MHVGGLLVQVDEAAGNVLRAVAVLHERQAGFEERP